MVAKEPVVPPPAPPPAPTVAAVPQGQSTTKVITVAGPGTVELAAAPWVALPPYFWKLENPETGEPIGQSTEISLKVMTGITLRENSRMIDLSRALGFQTKADVDEPELVRMTLAL